MHSSAKAVGLIVTPMCPQPGEAPCLPDEVLCCLDVVDDGGTLIVLDRCLELSDLATVLDWLTAAGVTVHRVVGLPTDPRAAVHDAALVRAVHHLPVETRRRP
jgi:hypothetical protein